MAEVEAKPRVCFEFEVEKIIGISSDGNYHVQWAPAWVSKFHLVGCEHLIQEFLLQQTERDGKPESENHFDRLDERADKMENNNLGGNFGIAQLELDGPTSLQQSSIKIEVDEESNNHTTDTFTKAADLPIPFNSSATGFNGSSTSNEHHHDYIYPDAGGRTSSEDPESYDEHQCSDDTSTSNYMSLKYHHHHIFPEAGARTSLMDTESFDKTHMSKHVAHEYHCDNISSEAGAETSSIDTESLNETLCTKYTSISKQMALEHDCDIISSETAAQSPSIDTNSFNDIQHSESVNDSIASTAANQKYACNICDKQFSSKRYCDVDHLMSHSSQKSFQCPYCEKKFAYSSGLSRHIRVHKEGKYACSHCEKTFTRRDYFTAHISSQNGVGCKFLKTLEENVQMRAPKTNISDNIHVACTL